jgi:hypothetical protein
VTLYGIACARQEALMVCDLPIGTFHPSWATSRRLTPGLLSDLAHLFPQAEARGFGAPSIPQLTRSEASSMSS